MELKKQAAALWSNNHSADNACATPASQDTSHMENIYDDPEFLYFFHSFLLENGPADFGTLSELLSGAP